MAERFAELLDKVARSSDDVLGIGIGIPGPVEFESGRPVNPPIMPGWDDAVARDGTSAADQARSGWCGTPAERWVKVLAGTVNFFSPADAVDRSLQPAA